MTKIPMSPGFSLQYLQGREIDDRKSSPSLFLRTRFDTAKSLFRKDLLSHYGCVNAIEFSNEGEWLASGGDDRRVLLWNVEKAIQGSRAGKPAIMNGEHASNIFCLGFDNHNTNIFSAGNDEQVIVHDMKTGASRDVFLHEEAVYGLSVDPLNDNVFASACDDGRILIWDIRQPPGAEPFCLASYATAFHAVTYNPIEPHLLATANSKEGVSLWDIRNPRCVLMRYRNGVHAQSCMSVRFNQTGSQILALRRRLPPVLYDVTSVHLKCQFDHPGYYNSCTMKSCCFAGNEDQYVLSGSDDFNLYMWKIPEEGSKICWVDEAHMVLKGHRSIVNQVRFNTNNFILASSGVEKIVKLWSPFSIPGSTGGIVSFPPTHHADRKVYTHEEYINLVLHSGQVMSHDYSHQSTQEDPRMMAFFDSLVQREIEGWTSDSSISSTNTESWLFNVAERVSISEVDSSSSDENIEDEEENEDTNNDNGEEMTSARTRSTMVGLLGGGERGQQRQEETGRQDGERGLRNGSSVANDQDEESTICGGSSGSGGSPRKTTEDNSTLNRISQLISQKRQQAMRSVKKKSLQNNWLTMASSSSSSATASNNNNSNSSSNNAKTKNNSRKKKQQQIKQKQKQQRRQRSEETFLDTLNTPSSSSSSSNHSLAIETSGGGGNSSNNTKKVVVVEESKISLVNSGMQSSNGDNCGTMLKDRRRLLAKRRAQILMDAEDDSEGSSSSNAFDNNKIPISVVFANSSGSSIIDAAVERIDYDSCHHQHHETQNGESSASIETRQNLAEMSKCDRVDFSPSSSSTTTSSSNDTDVNRVVIACNGVEIAQDCDSVIVDCAAAANNNSTFAEINGGGTSEERNNRNNKKTKKKAKKHKASVTQ